MDSTEGVWFSIKGEQCPPATGVDGRQTWHWPLRIPRWSGHRFHGHPDTFRVGSFCVFPMCAA